MTNGYMKLLDVINMFRSKGYGAADEGLTIILCPECEEWTWIKINVNSPIFNDIGDYIVQSLDISEDELEVWLKTSSYNVPMKWEELGADYANL